MSSSADDFIDVIQGNRVYLKCLYVSDINLLYFACYSNKEDALYNYGLANIMCADMVVFDCSPWFSRE